MKNLFLNFAAAATLVATISGCQVPYNSCTHTEYDDRVDEANAPFVKAAAKIYEERKKFKCDLELKPAESVGVFLSHSSNGLAIQKKKELLLLLESTLAERLAALRDFNVINRGVTAADTSAAAASADAAAKKYLMTYSISKLDLHRRKGSKTNFVNGKPRTVTYTYFNASAKIEISLYDPAGNTIFTFNEECVSRDSDTRDYSLLDEAVEKAVQQAIEKYSIATAPPLYVRQTTGGGTYVQISGGAAYGIRPGMKIRFYRNTVGQSPALPGEKTETVTHQQPVGSGTVGVNGAPVGSDDAWVYIDSGDPLFPCDFRKPEPQPRRTVFVWTSAKPE